MAILVAAMAWSAVAVAVDLPNIGESSETFLSSAEERQLGEAFMRNIRLSLRIIDDPEITNYIQALGQRLVTASDLKGSEFTFFVVEDPSINAFAGPGGYIGINSGLVATTESEDELASVLGHELAHVTQRHLARTFEAASKMSVPLTAAIIAAIVLGQKDGQLGEAALAATVAGNIQQQINFTRANEKEADRIGMQFLVNAGLDPKSMPVFFERLQRATRPYENQQIEFLMTHPVTVSRISDTMSRAEQYAYIPVEPTENYGLFKAKLRILAGSDHEANLNFFRRQLEDADSRDKVAARYGYTLALQATNKPELAAKELETLIRAYPNNISFKLALARNEADLGHPDKALEIYNHNLGLFPYNYPLTVAYATTLLAYDHADEARSLLNEFLRRHKSTPELYRLLAQAETDSGRRVEAHQALAEYYYLIGETATAIAQLNIALKLVDQADVHKAAMLRARLKDLKNEIGEDTR